MKSKESNNRPSRRQLLRQAPALTAAAVLVAQNGIGQTSGQNQPAPLPPATGRLQGKTAVITGAARGIGRSIAVAFAREGATIMGIDLVGPVSATVEYPAATPADLTETGRLVQAQGGRFIAVTADTRDRLALKAAAKQAERDLKHVDILVANAGIQVLASLLKMTDDQWDDNIQVNLTGMANTVRAFAPMMAERKQGSIIVTASGQGKKGFQNGSAYSASKWGTLGFMKSVALELGQYQVRVNALVPGLIATPMTLHEGRYKAIYEDYRPDPAPAHVTKEQAAQLRSGSTPMKLAWLSPDDMAPIVVFLGSDESRHVSGASFDIDAGDSGLFTA